MFGLLPTQQPIKLSGAAYSKTRVLVCAPSNAAIDEIVLRVLRKGLLDGKAQPYKPAIVRAGVTARMAPQVAEVTLDALVAKELGDGPSDYQEVCLCDCAAPACSWALASMYRPRIERNSA